MLFLTNFLAILLAGGVTFMLGGLGRLAVTGAHQRTRRNAFVLIVIAVLPVRTPNQTTVRRSGFLYETQSMAAHPMHCHDGTEQNVVSSSTLSPECGAATIHADDLPRDPAGVFRNEKSRQCRHIIGGA